MQWRISSSSFGWSSAKRVWMTQWIQTWPTNWSPTSTLTRNASYRQNYRGIASARHRGLRLRLVTVFVSIFVVIVAAVLGLASKSVGILQLPFLLSKKYGSLLSEEGHLLLERRKSFSFWRRRRYASDKKRSSSYGRGHSASGRLGSSVTRRFHSFEFQYFN